MKKILALYMVPPAAMDEMTKNWTPEERKKGMDEWMAWAEQHKEDLVELGTPVGKNKRVTKESVLDERNEVGGYSIAQAESHEAAAKIFDDCPHLKMPGAYIEVMECMDMQ